ncbi:hypothetical protein KW805_03100 [Candidatus Pacearchaeota archaeon]|nr:hypothetical protein [Candidatus Pacearchaeota archaeon]
MNRVSIVIPLLVIFSIALTSAAPNDDSQIILRLSSATNAHGAQWNESYPTIISYETLFGKAYAGSNPHACSNNNVLTLSDVANAHASVTGYPISVCYGDLACRIASGASASCTSNERLVASLSGTSNAHLASGGSYTNLVCCSSASAAAIPTHHECSGNVCAPVSNTQPNQADSCTSNTQCQQVIPTPSTIKRVYWTDLAGIPTTKSNVNKTVKIIADTSFPEGTEVSIDLQEDDGIYGTDDIHTVQATTNASGAAVYEWKITDDDMETAHDFFEYTDGTAEFFFIATIEDKSAQSGILTVDNIEGFDFNDIKARISDPIHRGIYFVGDIVEFNESSTSSTHPLTHYSWDIFEDDFTSEERSFVYELSSPGQKTITLHVADEDGRSREAQIAILVLGSPGLFAFINDPFHHQVISNKDLAINYSANESFIVERSSDACPTVTCLAGICPRQTASAPAACTALTIAVSGTPASFDEVTFNWSFDDNYRRDGKGSQFVSGFKQYPLSSLIYSDKLIRLNIYYNARSISNETERAFTLVGSSQCIGGRTLVIIGDDGSELDRRNTLTSDACKGVDGIIGANDQGVSDDCCPSGQICSVNGCSPQPVHQCSDYTESSSCTSDVANVGNLEGGPEGKDPLWAQVGCGQTTNGLVKQCACFWDSDKASCGLKTTSTRPVNDYGDASGGICSAGSCLYSTDAQTQCVNGVLRTDISSQFVAGTCTQDEVRQECENTADSYDLPCGQVGIELPFFSASQMALALAIILFIYCLAKLQRK